MKLRLEITVSPSSTFAFEHKGSSVRIGRDPDSELVLSGDIAQAVSWNHARIDLTPRGAFLQDVGSTNGTLLNDERLSARAPLQLGDKFQLGHTGPVLRVAELELAEAVVRPVELPRAVREKTVPDAAPLPVRRAEPERGPRRPAPAVADAPRAKTVPDTRGILIAMQRNQRNVVLGLIAGGGVLLLLAAVVLWKVAGRHAEVSATPVASAPPVESSSRPVEPPPPPPRDTEQSTPMKAVPQTTPLHEKKVPVDPASPSVGLANVAPAADVQDVGRYASPNGTPPSVLLQRLRDSDPWGRLQPNNRIYTGNYLLSLPGYRSRIELDSGVQLVLWGNVPEFSQSSPVLESTVMLHPPSAGTDAEFTLDHGRVRILNSKAAGPARVRVRFHRETWDLTLLDAASEVVLEYWSLYPPGVPFSKDERGKGLVFALGLFSKGQAQLQTRQQTYQLSNLSSLVWSNVNPAPIGPQTLPRTPDWWTDKIVPDKDHPELADVMLALGDYSKFLEKKESVVVDVVRTKVRESSDPALQTLGVLFLGALDGLPHLVDALEDLKSPRVRGTARHTLQRWMASNPDHDMELYRTLQEKKGFSAEKAEIILKLLHTFSKSEVERPETYQTLLAYLNHENLAIRELALYHLSLLVPQGAKTILYDTAAPEEKRKPEYEKWEKLLREQKKLTS